MPVFCLYLDYALSSFLCEGILEKGKKGVAEGNYKTCKEVQLHQKVKY